MSIKDGTPTGVAYFTRTGEDSFRANDPSRGPWSVDHCHAGPVTGLIARALEHAVPDKMLVRLTLDLVRAVPMAGITVRATVGHAGRSVATATAEVRDLDGRLCVAARSMHMVEADIPDMPTVPVQSPAFADARPGPVPLPGGLYDVPMFGDFIEVAYDTASPQGLGEKTVWMKVPRLLADEAPSAIQALCPLADCGNALSRNADKDRMTFVNTDLTIHVHRRPCSDWLASRTVSHWQPSGIGLAEATLYDTQGPVGVALQSLMLRPPRG